MKQSSDIMSLLRSHQHCVQNKLIVGPLDTLNKNVETSLFTEIEREDFTKSLTKIMRDMEEKIYSQRVKEKNLQRVKEKILQRA